MQMQVEAVKRNLELNYYNKKIIMMDILEQDKITRIKRQDEQISNEINSAKSFTYNTLAKTDWYILREADSGIATPDEIKKSRATLREKFSTFEAVLNAIDTKEDIVIALSDAKNNFYK
jgi:hypothetical protein